MDLKHSFTFGGVNTANYGIFISGEGVYNSPERDVTMLTVPGRNGQLTIDNGRFENIEVTYPCFVEAGTGATDISARIRAFRNAVGSLTGYQRLEDTYHSDEYREGIFRAGLEITPVVYHTGGEFEITFDCKPQRWLNSGEVPITLTPGQDDSGGLGLGVEMINPTEFNAAPLFKVYGGHGKIIISCDNGGVWPVYDVDISSGTTYTAPPLYADGEILDAYEIDLGSIVSHNADVAFGSADPSGRVYLMPSSIYTNWVWVPPSITAVDMIPRWWRI